MSEEKQEKPSLKKVTPRIKAQAEALWVTGEFPSVKALAEHLGVAPHALSFLKKEMKGRELAKVAEKVKESVQEAAAEEARLVQERAKETKEQHYKMAAQLARLTWEEIVRAKTAGLAFSTIAGNVKALEIAMSVLKKAREERFAVLGLDGDNVNDDGAMPELVIGELTDAEVQDLREAQEDDDFLGDIEAEPMTEPDPGVVDTTDEEPDDEVILDD